MTSDTDKVVFVGLTDLARATGKTRQRFSQLFADQGKSDSVLPAPDALINQSPAWVLDSVASSLISAGYSLDPQILNTIRSERAVSNATVPVGAYEAAEVLGGIPLSTLHSRSQDHAMSKPLFTMARKMVWDMDELILDARSRGFKVDEEAAVKWRSRNGRRGAVAWRQVEITLLVTARALASDDEAAARLVEGHAQRALLSPEPVISEHVRIAKAETRTVVL